VPPGRRVVGGVFQERGQGRAGVCEGGRPGKYPAERVDQGEDEVVAAAQVRPFVGEDRGELGFVQTGQGSAADHDGPLSHRQAVGDRERVIQDAHVIKTRPGGGDQIEHVVVAAPEGADLPQPGHGLPDGPQGDGDREAAEHDGRGGAGVRVAHASLEPFDDGVPGAG
jgi:hypothetical protein